MENLTTKYLGLTLKSPLIESSSRLTSTLGQLKEADSGAGAVVLKSLFEEQINYYIHSVPSSHGYPEADDYLANYIQSNSVDSYLELIKKAKKNLVIPVIPSINCFTSRGWTGFAKNISDAGADGMEMDWYGQCTGYQNRYFSFNRSPFRPGCHKIPASRLTGN